MTLTQQETAATGYALSKDRGVSDFWLPFVPGVSRISTKISGEQTDGRLLHALVVDDEINADDDTHCRVTAGIVPIRRRLR